MDNKKKIPLNLNELTDILYKYYRENPFLHVFVNIDGTNYGSPCDSPYVSNDNNLIFDFDDSEVQDVETILDLFENCNNETHENQRGGYSFVSNPCVCISYEEINKPIYNIIKTNSGIHIIT